MLFSGGREEGVMLRVEASVEIARPVEEVFAFSADVDNLPLWLTGVLEARKVTEGPLRKGTELEDVLQFLGKRFTSRLEVTEYEENRRMAFRTITGPIELDSVQTMEPTASGGTRVTHTAEGDPRGFFKVAEGVLQKMVHRQLTASLGNLKDLLEGARDPAS
jgi:uncharacterized protein YndB with AHSA1/START domain